MLFRSGVLASVQIWHTFDPRPTSTSRDLSILASTPSVKFRNPHPVAALRPAAPSPHTVLARIVEKSRAFWIIATFQTGKISAAEQVSGGLGERHKKLFRLIQFKFESAFELPRSLDYLRDARRLGDQEVDRINTSARNRPARDNRLGHSTQ